MQCEWTTFGIAVWLLAAALPSPATAVDSPADRRARIQVLSPSDKEHLRRQQEQFNEEPQRREHLRKLHDELERDPNRTRLLAVMERYSKWLESVPPAKRAELKDLPPASRLAMVKRLKEEQSRRRPLALGPQDKAAVVRWLVAHKSPEGQRERLLGFPPDEQLKLVRRSLMAKMLTGQQRGALVLTEEEVQSLAAELSPPLKDRLLAAPAPERQRRAAAIVWQTVRPAVNPEQLRKFYELLPESQKEQLQGLSPEEKERKLRQLFHRQFEPGRPNRPFGQPDRNFRPNRPGPFGRGRFPQGPAKRESPAGQSG